MRRLSTKPVKLFSHSLLLLAVALALVLGVYFQFSGYWAVLTSVAVVYGGSFLLVLLYMSVCSHLPIWLQVPAYLMWKYRVEQTLKTKGIHPLIDFPLQLFLEFQLDEEFWKGGVSGAQAALSQWLDRTPNRIVDALSQAFEPRLDHFSPNG